MLRTINTPWFSRTLSVQSGLIDDNKTLGVAIRSSNPHMASLIQGGSALIELNLAATEEMIAALQEAVREFKAGEAK